jgi:hypothetical protein
MVGQRVDQFGFAFCGDRLDKRDADVLEAALLQETRQSRPDVRITERAAHIGQAKIDVRDALRRRIASRDLQLRIVQVDTKKAPEPPELRSVAYSPSVASSADPRPG